uniref:Amino acid transporter transmembrane domain-containing protein n=1 Tax=Strongyloides stercoralis TaxID=6248 RepID=A0A0K0ELQ5_STRER
MFYVCNGHMFASKDEMIEEVKSQYRVSNFRYINLLYYPKKSKYFWFKLKNNKHSFEKIKIDSIEQNKKINYEIKKVYNCSGSVCYQCGNKFFPTYQLAVRYLKIKQTKLQFNDEKVQEFRKEEAPNQVSINKNIITNPHKDAEEMREELEKKYIPNVFSNGIRVSNSIWNKIWSGYTYNVYSKNKFSILKQMYLKEINKYRKLHKVKALIEDNFLDSNAQLCANKYVAQKNPEFSVNEKFNLMVGTIPYLDSPLIVKNWYDEGSLFTYNKPNGTTKTEHFSQLIWKGTKKLGIGVAKKREYMYIIFLFHPKGNIPNQYEKNVLPRKIKY